MTDQAVTDTRLTVLEQAARCVTQDRCNAYGRPEVNFSRIAALWNAYLRGKGLDVTLTTVDVAILSALIKVARLEQSPEHLDSWTDLAGYAACGAACALPRP